MAFVHKFFTSLGKYADGDTRTGELNRLWYDSVTNTIRIGDGTLGGKIVSGGGLGSTVHEGAIPPIDPKAGDMWWSTYDGNLYVYYDSSWISASSMSYPPATAITFTPTTPSDWNTTPTTLQAALDEIAARLTAANL